MEPGQLELVEARHRPSIIMHDERRMISDLIRNLCILLQLNLSNHHIHPLVRPFEPLGPIQWPLPMSSMDRMVEPLCSLRSLCQLQDCSLLRLARWVLQFPRLLPPCHPSHFNHQPWEEEGNLQPTPRMLSPKFTELDHLRMSANGRTFPRHDRLNTAWQQLPRPAFRPYKHWCLRH